MLSEKDMKILRILREDCKLPAREISKKTGLPITTIHNRIKKMEKDGIIKSYVANIDQKKIGEGVQAFIQLRLKSSPELVAKRLTAIEGVKKAYIISGSTDVMLNMSVKDIDALHNFITEKLKNIKQVERTTTSIVLKEFNKPEVKILKIT